MNHQPPPFFKRGPAPLVQLSFYTMISLALMVVDFRLQTLELIRQGISLVTYPIQQAAQAPIIFLQNATHYVSSINGVQEENSRLKRSQIDNVEALLRTEQLEAENARLRDLLEVKSRDKMNGRVARILYAARDPFSRRIVIDKGQHDGIVIGQAAIDDVGMVGQVTRLSPFAAEVTLVTDKNQAVPVQIVRNGLRSVVFGVGNGQLELRFMPANADVQTDDLLVTSGLDGVFLPGIPVARISRIERNTSYSFAQIYCDPVAKAENFTNIIVLDPIAAVDIPDELKEAKVIDRAKKRKR